MEQITRSILKSTGSSIKKLGFNIQLIENLDIALAHCPMLEEITLFYLSNERQNKAATKIVNRLEKSWKERLSSLPSYREISFETLVLNKPE